MFLVSTRHVSAAEKNETWPIFVFCCSFNPALLAPSVCVCGFYFLPTFVQSPELKSIEWSVVWSSGCFEKKKGGERSSLSLNSYRHMVVHVGLGTLFSFFERLKWAPVDSRYHGHRRSEWRPQVWMCTCWLPPSVVQTDRILGGTRRPPLGDNFSKWWRETYLNSLNIL